jgi:hypothetical protein
MLYEQPQYQIIPHVFTTDRLGSRESGGAVSRFPAKSINMMEIWYFVSLGDGMTSSVVMDEIEEAFAPAFATAGSPAAMAVFTRPESEGRLHCEVIAYFSPASRDVAKAFDAKPCEKPARTGLDLLAGNEDSWSVLFPKSSG